MSINGTRPVVVEMPFETGDDRFREATDRYPLLVENRLPSLARAALGGPPAINLPNIMRRRVEPKCFTCPTVVLICVFALMFFTVLWFVILKKDA